MKTCPSPHEPPENEAIDPSSENSKERLFGFIKKCNGAGVDIEGIFHLMGNGGVKISDFHKLQIEKKIQTQVVRNKIVWVASCYSSTDRI